MAVIKLKLDKKFSLIKQAQINIILGSLVVSTPDSHPGGQGSIPCMEIQNFVIFAPFSNFKGLQPFSANFSELKLFAMLIYKVQRVARAKSYSPAPTCSMCHFSMENCNFQVQKCQFFALFALLIITKTFTNQLCQLRRLVRTPRAQEIQKTKFIF